MRKRWRLFLVVFLVLLLFSSPLAATTPSPAQVDERSSSEAAEVQGTMASPLFIENVGQFDDAARFQMWGGPGTMWLAEDGLWITMLEPVEEEESGPALREADRGLALAEKEAPREAVHLRLSFAGANPRPRLEPFDRQETAVSYFIGADADEWRADVPVWGGVRYVDLYPGLDLEIRGENGRWMWRMVGEEGATDALSQVRLRVEGARAVDLARAEGGEGGSTHVKIDTALGDLALPLLEAAGRALEAPSQEMQGADVEILNPFSSSVSAHVAGDLSLHDNKDDLVYATFLGGGGWDWGSSIAVDGAGSAYVTGSTDSPEFPAAWGPGYDTEHGGSRDAFVAKLNAAGTGLEYATFLGGETRDYGSQGRGVAVDGVGSAYVTGITSSTDFPAAEGPGYDTSFNGGGDAFAVKLNATGTRLEYATFLGGGGTDGGSSIAVDGVGGAYVTGCTRSADFPAAEGPGYDTSHNGYVDAFVVKLDATGTGLEYATFLGGWDEDTGSEIAVDGKGCAYVTGDTRSADFPATGGPGYDTSFNGATDAFLIKLDAAGTGLEYATFLGGGGVDGFPNTGIAVDGEGCAYVTGSTSSTDFPAAWGPGYDTSLNGDVDAFVVKMNAAGTGLEYASFLGGEDWDGGYGIAVDGTGGVYVTGYTYSADFPVGPGYDTIHNGDQDAFVVKLNAAGTELEYATFLGGGDSDGGSDIAVDRTGCGYVTGSTRSPDFPAAWGPGYDTSFNGSMDAFVIKLAMGGGPGPEPDPEFSISHIEVTQAIQDEGNDVTLIAGKPTFVRVYVDCGEGCSSLPNVTGVLKGQDSAGELDGSPLSPVNLQITAFHSPDWTTQRGDLERTLNFTLPPSWASESIELMAEVAGVQYSEIATFREARPMNVLYVPIDDNDEEPDSSRIADAWRLAPKLFPTAQLNYIPMPSWEWNRPLKCKLKYALAEDHYQDCVRKDLKLQLTDLYRDQTVGGYIFGWLPEASYDYVGVEGSSDPTWNGGIGKAAFGICRTEESVRAGVIHPQRLLAHEIGHLLGARHTNADDCTDRDPDTYWPDSTTARIRNYGVDGSSFGWYVSSPSAAKDPSETYDYMSYCGRVISGTVWISAWTYDHIYSETLGTETLALNAQTYSADEPYLQVRGLVFDDDTASLASAWVFTPTLPLRNPAAGTQYCLEAQDVSGAPLVSHCFDLGFHSYETGEPSAVDGFNVGLPYPTDLARIVLRKGSQDLATRNMTPNAPVVSVLSPDGGETWSPTGTYTITWTASDADDDPLTYRVLYSPDGHAWVPVGSAITETHLTVNAAELAGGDNARVRVMASDGINTSTDESEAPFTVGNKAPDVHILMPEGEGSISYGASVLLRGYGYDLEDGVLGEGAYQWVSDRDGELATGSQALVTLSPGVHIITLTVTDSAGKTGTAQIEVRVDGAELFLPLIMR